LYRIHLKYNNIHFLEQNMNYLELIEKKSHGTPNFPIEYYYIDKSHPRYVMNAHWHKEFEIVRVLEGGLCVHINNAKYDLERGEAIFAEGGCLISAYPENCIYECIVFDAAMLKRLQMSDSEKYFFDGLSSKFSFKNFFDKSDEEILFAIDSLFKSLSEPRELFELEVTGLLYKIFSEMQKCGYVTKKSASPSDKRLKTVTTLIDRVDANITEPISLSELSAATGLCEKYLCRIFKLYTSKTLTEYVNERRIEKACTEMATHSITEAAFASGFNDLSYFCKLFKRYKGLSPSEYKKKYIK